MEQVFGGILAGSESFNHILIIGVAVFFGTAGAKIFQKLHIPQIIGFIVIGIILGPVLGLITSSAVDSFEPFNVFALGIIGFLIGGELERDIFVKFGKQVFAILLFEGLAAFLLVGSLSFLVMLYFASWSTALAVAVVFGAICAATDPASTMNVLWEYKTRGPLTTMLTAIVALDDALALVLYIISVSIAGFLMGHQQGSFLSMTLGAVYEIAGSLALGVAFAFVLRWIIRRIDDTEKILAFTLGTIVLTIGLAKTYHMDVILSSMAIGVTLINILPRRSLKSFELIRKFSPPVYVLFFVIIGARLNVTNLSWQIWLLVAAYVTGSIIGKTSGSYMGSVYSNAAPVVKKYLGYCLYQQGAIAIALLIMASARFEGAVRETMLSVIIIGVLILQLIGPLFVKWGAKKASEVGMNITTEDLIKSYTVKDVMDSNPVGIAYDMPFQHILEIFSTTDFIYYPVIDRHKNLTGIITIAGIKEMFAHQDVAGWLLACDVAEPVMGKMTPNKPLKEAMEHMKRYDLEHMSVVAGDESDELVGVLDYRMINRKISAEVLARQQKADSLQNV